MLGLGLECILHSFQEVICVRGGWCLMVLLGRTEHEAGVLCGGIDFYEVRFFIFLCVGLRFLYGLPVASPGVPVLPVASLAWQPSTCLLVVGGFFCPSEVGLFVAAL